MSLSNSFVAYLGWLYRWGEPLTLIGHGEDQIAEAQRELVRIGIDELAGAAVGDIDNLRAGTELRSYRVADFTELKDARCNNDLTVIDVRQHNEYASGHLPGALSVPLHELISRMDEVPDVRSGCIAPPATDPPLPPQCSTHPAGQSC